jgi:hypothetical protein
MMNTGMSRLRRRSSRSFTAGIIVTASWDSARIWLGRTGKACGNSSLNLAGTGRGENIALRFAGIRAAPTRGDTV